MGDNVAKWKDNMKMNAKLNFEKNQVVNWNNLVYGKEAKIVENERTNEMGSDDENDFFKVGKLY